MHETSGAKATPEVLAFFAKAGHPEVQSDEVAWCAAFAGACLADAGMPNTGSLMARSYLTYGTALDQPKVGAIAVFKRGSDPSQGHVAFVTGWGKGTLRCLGGNQRDSVCEENFRSDNLLGLRWPPVEPEKALVKSGTIWGSLGAGVAGVGAYLEEGWQTVTQTIAAMTEIQPLRDGLASVAGNSRGLAFSVTIGCLALVVCRRVKARAEGKTG